MVKKMGGIDDAAHFSMILKICIISRGISEQQSSRNSLLT
jgi:hypothetical protein